MINVYNTLSGKKEKFEPVSSDNTVRMYSCGATVQGEPHIGHMRAAITADIIRRTFMIAGYEIISVYNFTDIDDKLIEKSLEMGIDYRKLAADNIEKYMNAMNSLNILPFTHYPHATKHIEEIIELIEKLIDSGYAYEVNGNVYFRVNRYSEYGKLSGKKTEQLISGKRVNINNEKENPLDFALWKRNENNEPFWNASFGKGRPGWHIECSAMSMKYLGETFDIHSGGEDLIFPHHENEIAQSCAVTGKVFAKYWMHNGMVNLKGEKMSKSIGNVFTIESILNTYEPDIIRMYIYKTHYRKGIEFSTERLDEAKSAFLRIKNALGNHDSTDRADEHAYRRFTDSLFDDINTPEALSVVFELINSINAGEGDEYVMKSTVMKMMRDMGFIMSSENAQDIDGFIELFIDLRNRAKNSRDFDTADYIRHKLQDLGITLKDTKEGTVWQRSDK